MSKILKNFKTHESIQLSSGFVKSYIITNEIFKAFETVVIEIPNLVAISLRVISFMNLFCTYFSLEKYFLAKLFYVNIIYIALCRWVV